MVTPQTQSVRFVELESSCSACVCAGGGGAGEHLSSGSACTRPVQTAAPFPTRSLTTSLSAAKAGIMTTAEVCQVTCLRLVEYQVPTRMGPLRVGGNVKQSEARRQREPRNGEAEKSKCLKSVDTLVYGDDHAIAF